MIFRKNINVFNNFLIIISVLIKIGISTKIVNSLCILLQNYIYKYTKLIQLKTTKLHTLSFRLLLLVILQLNQAQNIVFLVSANQKWTDFKTGFVRVEICCNKSN